MRNIEAVNWNKINDSVDLEVWNRMTSNFWLPEKVALSNDIKTWNSLSESEQDATMKVFGGLTLLDTIQGTVGAQKMIQHALTPHEEANYTFIGGMESIHARSYSSIFSTLCSSEQIEYVFDWVKNDETLQRKAHIILDWYDQGPEDPYGLRMKAASVLLESFLFYSGFFLPFNFAANGKLTNTADIIRLILRDEGVHGYYIGYKFQKSFNELTEWEQIKLEADIVSLATQLYENEIIYTQNLYDPIGWTEDVKTYLRYNANKAMSNLGLEKLFAPSETRVKATILSSMSLDTNETHDFFSGSGSSYVIGEAEETTDDDWDF